MAQLMKRIIQGPEGHPLRDLSITWRTDGAVQLTAREGRAITIVSANLRNRRAAHVCIAPDPTQEAAS